MDALIGHQTRPHEDVDAVLEPDTSCALVDCLRTSGFAEVPRDDNRPCNFVLGHPSRCLSDFHLVTFDDQGNGLYSIPNPEGVYPAQAFSGRRRILNRPVKCMSADFQIANHNTGYALRGMDRADMNTLATALDLSLPSRFLG